PPPPTPPLFPDTPLFRSALSPPVASANFVVSSVISASAPSAAAIVGVTSASATGAAACAATGVAAGATFPTKRGATNERHTNRRSEEHTSELQSRENLVC